MKVPGRAAISLVVTEVSSSAASALLLLKCPARNTRSWCTGPSSVARRSFAVQDSARFGVPPVVVVVVGTPWSVISVSVRAPAPRPARRSACTRVGGAGQEVVAGDQRAGRARERAPAVVTKRSSWPWISSGVSTSRPTARSGTGSTPPLTVRSVTRAVGVLPEHLVGAQARLRRRVVAHRRHVVRLRAEARAVGVPEERDDGVAAQHHDVRRPVAVRPVAVDDVAQRLGDQVLGVGAARVGVGLRVEQPGPLDVARRRRARPRCGW